MRGDRLDLHDLRRTFATNLAALKVPPHIVERLSITNSEACRTRPMDW